MYCQLTYIFKFLCVKNNNSCPCATDSIILIIMYFLYEKWYVTIAYFPEQIAVLSVYIFSLENTAVVKKKKMFNDCAIGIKTGLSKSITH